MSPPGRIQTTVTDTVPCPLCLRVYARLSTPPDTAMSAATTGRGAQRDRAELWVNAPAGEKLHQFYFISCPLLLLPIQTDDECCF